MSKGLFSFHNILKNKIQIDKFDSFGTHNVNQVPKALVKRKTTSFHLSTDKKIIVLVNDYKGNGFFS